jgi:hypothetical protein
MTAARRGGIAGGTSAAAFTLLVAVAAVFVWHSSQGLPPMVASHFGATGYANGFIPRGTYIVATLCALVLLPLAVVVPISVALNKPNAVINLPNRDYWLTAQRRPATIAFIRRQMLYFGVGLLTFICYVHWLVVKANGTAPPTLPSSTFMLGLVTFATFVVLWVGIYLKRFRNLE